MSVTVAMSKEKLDVFIIFSGPNLKIGLINNKWLIKLVRWLR